ncbi:hypothetical protein Ancab_020769 [Ancistrocladus abbreviatus]
MGSSDFSDDIININEWEQIQSPFSPSERANHEDDCSMFPPSVHESLETASEEDPSQESSAAPPAALLGSENEADPPRSRWLEWRLQVVGEIGRQMKLWVCNFSKRIIWVVSNCWPFMVYRVKFCSAALTASLVAAAVVSLLRARMLQRHRVAWEKKIDELHLLITEKDQRINQLVIQIAQMNEMLSARRRVPVVRILAER